MREVSFPSLNEVKSFRNALNSERGVFGPFMITGDPALVECAGYAGYDFVLLDMEHGPGSFEQLQNLIRAANVAKVMPVVRVPRGSDIFIDRALDVGAGAVLGSAGRVCGTGGRSGVRGEILPRRNPAARAGSPGLRAMAPIPAKTTSPRRRTPWS